MATKSKTTKSKAIKKKSPAKTKRDDYGPKKTTFPASYEPSSKSRLGQGKGDVKKGNTGRTSQNKNRTKK